MAESYVPQYEKQISAVSKETTEEAFNGKFIEASYLITRWRPHVLWTQEKERVRQNYFAI
jgi:hypothetical protein